MVASRTNDTGLTLDIGHNNNTNHTTDEGTDKRTPDVRFLYLIVNCYYIFMTCVFVPCICIIKFKTQKYVNCIINNHLT